MKSLSLFLALVLISISAYAADVEISFTIPSDKVDYAAEGYLAKYPNTETIPDPEWVDPEDGTECPQVPKYTTIQWVRYNEIQKFKADVYRGHEILNVKEARANTVSDDGVAN